MKNIIIELKEYLELLIQESSDDLILAREKEQDFQEGIDLGKLIAYKQILSMIKLLEED